MPLIAGEPTTTRSDPTGRIRNTRKLLLTAAVIMSVFLLGSSIVVSTLITAVHHLPKRPAMRRGRWRRRRDDNRPAKPPAGPRAGLPRPRRRPGRVINPLFGDVFGTIYDISTVVILWFAGASAMAGC